MNGQETEPSDAAKVASTLGRRIVGFGVEDGEPGSGTLEVRLYLDDDRTISFTGWGHDWFGLFVEAGKPEPRPREDDRCIMGYPVHPDWHCLARTRDGELFCVACQAKIDDPTHPGCGCENCRRGMYEGQAGPTDIVADVQLLVGAYIEQELVEPRGPLAARVMEQIAFAVFGGVKA